MTDEEVKRSYEYYKQWQNNKVRYRNESIAYVLMFGFGLFFVIKNWQGVLLGLGIALVIGATCLLIRVLCMWNRKRQALLELKTMAEKMGAKDIQIDSEKGTISFVTASENIDENKFEELEKSLSDKGLKMKVSRTREAEEDNLKMPKGKSTEKGYINKNNQKNNGITQLLE